MSERPQKRRNRRRGTGPSAPPDGAADGAAEPPADAPAGGGAPAATPRPSPPEAEATPRAAKKKAKGSIQLKSARSLERLKERVAAAVEEIERLRRENATLAERISQLEGRPLIDEDGALLVFDEDSEALRRKVDGFIAAIDQYLGGDGEAPAQPTPPSSDDPPA